MDELCRRMAAALDAAAPHAVAEVAQSVLSSTSGIDEVVLWISDFADTRLIDMTGLRPDKAIAGSSEGRCLIEKRHGRVGGRSFVPIARRRQQLGVLSVRCSQETGDRLASMATIIANALVAAAEQSDELARKRGAERLTLPATIQHELLPMRAYEGPDFEVGAQIEPAYDIAGDTYDYSIDENGVHVGIFDAVGHGLRATLIATTVLGAYRRGRLIADSLPQLATGVDAALSEILEPGEFVTGLMMRFEPRRRTMQLWNAGHLSPLLIRSSGATERLAGPQTLLPFGLGTAGDPTDVELHAGDLVLAYTDGVVQARNPSREMLGEDIVAELARSQMTGEPLPDLCRSVLARVSGHVERRLTDDATIVAVRVPL